jgi:pimeloyl-ACP methyl ester carboxylesterase
VLGAIRAAASGWWEAWASIRCPTLIVRGERGLASDEAAAMAARLPDPVVETIPGAGHDVHLERPDEWRRAVERFLETDQLPRTGA